MPQLDPSTFGTQLFWLFIAFTVLFLIVWKVALPRITDVREVRQNRIDDDLDKASGMKAEAESVLEAYEQALAAATNEAQELQRQAAAELGAERTRLQEDLAQDAVGESPRGRRPDKCGTTACGGKSSRRDAWRGAGRRRTPDRQPDFRKRRG